MSAMPVVSWPASAAGGFASALARCCPRRRWDAANGQSRTATRTGTNAAETTGNQREVGVGSAVGRWPNPALQRIAARWRFCLKLNGLG